MIEKINLAATLATIKEPWRPQQVGLVNGQAVKLVRLRGEFVWHHHAEDDELFLVVSGRFRMELRDQPALELTAGEFCVVPRGVEHRPVADEEAEVLLFETAGLRNTGNVVDQQLTAPQ